MSGKKHVQLGSKFINHHDEYDYRHHNYRHCMHIIEQSVQRRNNGRNGVKSPASPSFSQPFIQAQIKEASKLRVTGLCAGNSPVAREFPA